MTDREGLGPVLDFLLETRLSDVPPDVVDDARLSLIDTVGCMVGGSTARRAQSLMRSVATPGGAATLLGTHLRTSQVNAVQAGFIAGAWFDLDSGHRHPSTRPPVPGIQPPLHVVPVLFAIAEEASTTGERLLLAYLLSYEIAARLGIATMLRPGLHGHGMQATVGAGIAAALLLGTDRRCLETTVQLAAGLCVMGSMRAALEGATVRNAFGGMGAANGLLAFQLARRGFTATRGQLADVFDGVGSTAYDLPALVRGLGRDWETSLGYYKIHACCRWCHPALDALVQVLDRTPLQAEEIDHIEVRTFAFAASLTTTEPASELAAKFSIPYALAARIVLGSSGFRAFDEEALHRPDIRALARRIEVREDPKYSAALPEHRPTRVDVHTKDGGACSATVQGSRGDPADRFSRRDIEVKFLELCGAALGEAKAARALQLMLTIDQVGPVQSLIEVLSTASPR